MGKESCMERLIINGCLPLTTLFFYHRDNRRVKLPLNDGSSSVIVLMKIFQWDMPDGFEAHVEGVILSGVLAGSRFKGTLFSAHSGWLDVVVEPATV